MLLQPLLPTRPANHRIPQASATATAIKVVGVGAEGWSRVSQMLHRGAPGVSFTVVDGGPVTAGESPAEVEFIRLGDQPSRDPALALQRALVGAELVFVVTGAVRDYDTPALSGVARAAREAGALVVGVVTPTFKFEETTGGKLAPGAERLLPFVDRILTIHNRRMGDFVDRDVGLLLALASADLTVAEGLMDLLELVSPARETGLDLAEVKAMLGQPGGAVMSTGADAGAMAVREATRQAIGNPVMERSLAGALGALFLVKRGDQLPFGGVTSAGASVINAVSKETEIRFGSLVAPELADQARVVVVAAGVEARPVSHRTALPQHIKSEPRTSHELEPVSRVKESEMTTNRKSNEPNAHRQSGLLGILTWPALAFSRVMAGPPMAERDRTNLSIADARVRNYQGPFR